MINSDWKDYQQKPKYFLVDNLIEVDELFINFKKFFLVRKTLQSCLKLLRFNFRRALIKAGRSLLKFVKYAFCNLKLVTANLPI